MGKAFLLLLVAAACLFGNIAVDIYLIDFEKHIFILGTIIIVIAMIYGFKENKITAKVNNGPTGLFFEGVNIWINIGFALLSVSNVALLMVYGFCRVLVFSGAFINWLEPSRPVYYDDGTMNGWE